MWVSNITVKVKTNKKPLDVRQVWLAKHLNSIPGQGCVGVYRPESLRIEGGCVHGLGGRPRARKLEVVGEDAKGWWLPKRICMGGGITESLQATGSSLTCCQPSCCTHVSVSRIFSHPRDSPRQRGSNRLLTHPHGEMNMASRCPRMLTELHMGNKTTIQTVTAVWKNTLTTNY